MRLQGSIHTCMHPIKFLSHGRGIMVADWPLVFEWEGKVERGVIKAN